MIVIDASILTNVVGDDGPEGDEARQVLSLAGTASAPDLADVETVAVLRKRWISGDLTKERFASAVDDLADLNIRRWPTLPLMRRAFELRDNVTPYDAAYVALAELLDCTLVTADSRLAAAPNIRCHVRLLPEPAA